MDELIMKIIFIIIGISILFLLNFLSNAIVAYFHLHFPAPLIGMLMLAILIHFKVIPIRLIEDGCQLLLNNLALFFVPLVVSMVLYSNILAKNALPIILIVVISSVIIISVTGLTVEHLIGKQKKVK